MGFGWPDDAVERARVRVGRALFGARADVRPIVGRFEIEGPVPPPGVTARVIARDPAAATTVVLQFVGDGKVALLEHPNVVPVTEVLEHAGSIVLVMERVPAESLRAWVERRRRSVADIVHAHLGAGLGLAAAHAVGLVHRGFGTDAVVRDLDGRVRLLAADLVHAWGHEGLRRDVTAFCDALRGSLLLSDGARVGHVHAALDRCRGLDELLVSLREAAACRTRT